VGEVTDIVATVPVEAWLLFSIAAGATAFRQFWPHIANRLGKSRFERRSRERYVSSDELSLYRNVIGDRPEPVDTPSAMGRVLFEGLMAGLPPWLMALTDNSVGLRILGAAFGISLAAITWRWLNDPDRNAPWERARIPREAMLGFGAAVLIVAVLLGIMIEFF
jgi:hypothetical protein